MPSTKVEGYLDSVKDARAQGWVWNSANPSQRLLVQVLVDSRLAAEGRADLHRADLVKAGIGDGAYGFEVTIPQQFVDGAAHEVSIFIADTEAELRGARRDVVLTAPKTPERLDGPVKPPPPGASAPNAEEPTVSGPGGLYGIKDGRLRGWVADVETGGDPIRVELQVDGRPAAIVAADQPDEKLKGGVKKGRRRFTWTLGRHLLDGRDHELRARILGEPTELEGGPITFKFSPTPEVAAPTPQAPALKCNLAPPKGDKVWGWAWDKTDPKARLEVQIFVDGKPAAKLVADKFFDVLERKGVGDARHGFSWKVDPKYADGKPHQISAKAKGQDIKGGPLTLVLKPPSAEPSAAPKSAEPASRPLATIGVTTAPKAKAEADAAPAAPMKAPAVANAAVEVRAPGPKTPMRRVKGTLDAVIDLQVTGWARDSAEPKVRQEVEIQIDGARQAIIVADQFRRSLKERGLADTRHGFVWTMDSGFADGRQHQISVKAGGQELTGSPAHFTIPKRRAAGLPPLSISRVATPTDPRAAFLAETVLSMRRTAREERQEFLKEVSVLDSAVAELGEAVAGLEDQSTEPPALSGMVEDLRTAVRVLSLKLARE